MSTQGYSAVPLTGIRPEEHRRKLAIAVNSLLQGKLNAVISLTLTANAASTTITDARLTPNSFLWFMPQTANAAAEIGNGTMYVASSTLTNRSAVVTHANNAQTDRSFRVLIIG